MRAVLIIMPCSLAGMKMGKPGTLFFVGFMIPEKNLLNLTLEGGSLDKYRLELGGISAPKEGETHREMKKPPALEHFLSKHPEIEEIEICTDNDFAGRWACANLKKAYGTTYRIIENLPQIEGADYADLAKVKKEEKKKARAAPER